MYSKTRGSSFRYIEKKICRKLSRLLSAPGRRMLRALYPAQMSNVSLSSFPYKLRTSIGQPVTSVEGIWLSLPLNDLFKLLESII